MNSKPHIGTQKALLVEQTYKQTAAIPTKSKQK
jgi:hypothetical protein